MVETLIPGRTTAEVVEIINPGRRWSLLECLEAIQASGPDDRKALYGCFQYRNRKLVQAINPHPVLPAA